MKNKTVPILGASLWILGLILFVVGLNIRSSAGSWMTVVGNILFLAGLGLEGVVWFRKRKEQGNGEK